MNVTDKYCKNRTEITAFRTKIVEKNSFFQMKERRRDYIGFERLSRWKKYLFSKISSSTKHHLPIRVFLDIYGDYKTNIYFLKKFSREDHIPQHTKIQKKNDLLDQDPNHLADGDFFLKLIVQKNWNYNKAKVTRSSKSVRKEV